MPQTNTKLEARMKRAETWLLRMLQCISFDEAERSLIHGETPEEENQEEGAQAPQQTQDSPPGQQGAVSEA